MLALCLMLLPSYYAQNYAGIIGSSLNCSQLCINYIILAPYIRRYSSQLHIGSCIQLIYVHATMCTCSIVSSAIIMCCIPAIEYSQTICIQPAKHDYNIQEVISHAWACSNGNLFLKCTNLIVQPLTINQASILLKGLDYSVDYSTHNKLLSGMI